MLQAASAMRTTHPTVLLMAACITGPQLWHFRQAAIPVLALARYSPSIRAFAPMAGIYLAKQSGIRCQAMFRAIAVAAVAMPSY